MNAERVCYVDSSAIVKLVVRENESAALWRYLRGRSLVSSALARVEITRAVMPHGARTLRTDRLIRRGARLEVVRHRNSASRWRSFSEQAKTRRRPPGSGYGCLEISFPFTRRQDHSKRIPSARSTIFP